MFDNSSIHFRALVTIVKGKREEYKKLVQEMSRAVEANEPGTLHYQFYLNRDETKCIVNEIYADSEATPCSHKRRCISDNTSKDSQFL